MIINLVLAVELSQLCPHFEVICRRYYCPTSSIDRGTYSYAFGCTSGANRFKPACPRDKAKVGSGRTTTSSTLLVHR